MLTLLKKLLGDRKGNALVIAGASLPLIIGSAGLASDTIEWTLMKRQLQRTADSAALAGVYGKLASQTVATGTCSTANSQPVYRDVYTQSNANGRVAGTVACSVGTPASPWNGSGYNAVNVTVSAVPTLAFAGLFISSSPTISASATAAVVQYGRYCAKALDNNTETGVSFTGSAIINLGCGIITNAKGGSAVSGGGSASVTASPIAAVGAISDSGVFADGTVLQPYSPPTTDPYAALNPPAVPSGCNQSAIRGSASSVSASNTTVCYKDLTLSSGQSATFTDTVVILNGGDLTANAGSTLTCVRCTFVLTTDATTITSNSIGKVVFNGGAHVDLTAPDTGTYAGLVIYKDRRAPYCNNCNKINGDSTSFIQGGIYVPTQELQFSGDSGMNTACVQLVAWQLQFIGNTDITNVCPGGPRGWDGSMVRLVA